MCGYLKLDGTEDDDDDDDEMTQNKLLILVAKDVKTGTYAATCLQEKGVSEYVTSWLVSLLRQLGCRRAILHSDGEPSIVALKTATLLASPFVELVLRESPVGEHATNGVAESAMREMKPQTRTLKFATEADVGKIVQSHSIWKWIPTMAADAIAHSCFGSVCQKKKTSVQLAWLFLAPICRYCQAGFGMGRSAGMENTSCS